jgi:hypothetical protein
MLNEQSKILSVALWLLYARASAGYQTSAIDAEHFRLLKQL